jgi:hypothetical protein
VWNWTKNARLANRPADDTDWWFGHLIDSLTELKQRPDLLASLVDHSGLSLNQATFLANAA